MPRPIIVPMSPAGLSLGRVALPQSPPPFHPATVTLRDGGLVIQLSWLPMLSALFACVFKFPIASTAAYLCAIALCKRLM